MWAPADLFGPGLSTFTLLAKGIATYFYEHLVVLAITILLVAALITVLTLMRSRRGEQA